MALITLEEAKGYLRVDTADEDAMIGTLLYAAEKMCADVARLSNEQWEDIISDKSRSCRFSAAELATVRDTLRVAILYTVGYLFEHREEADHHALALTLRSLLFAIREGVV